MDKKDIQLVFGAISTAIGVIVGFLTISSSKSEYLNWIPTDILFLIMSSLIFLVLLFTIWYFFKQSFGNSGEAQKWYNDVEQTINGIQQAWNYSGVRPREEARKRTAEEMDKYTNELKNHRSHPIATEELIEIMNRIIELWDRSRDLIMTTNRSIQYDNRGERIINESEDLKELLNKEQQGRVRTAFSNIPEKARNGIERIRKLRYQPPDPLPFEIHREMNSHLSDDHISKFTKEHAFLCLTR